MSYMMRETLTEGDITYLIVSMCNGDRRCDRCWYYKGKLHRENGPAIEYSDGTAMWFRDGLKHRMGGPAVLFSTGHVEYYLHGMEYSYDQYNKELRKDKLLALQRNITQ